MEIIKINWSNSVLMATFFSCSFDYIGKTAVDSLPESLHG